MQECDCPLWEGPSGSQVHNMSDVQLPNVKKYEVDYLLLGVTFESEAPTVHLVVSAFMVLLGCANVAKYSAVKKYLLSS